jgi:ornithine cyclodeaminase/alanine dehydrogenase
VLILRDAELRELLTVDESMSALRAMLAEQAADGIRMPERVTADIASGGFLRVMPSIHHHGGYMGFKFMDVIPKVGARYAIALFDIADGGLRALIDADYVTMVRTSATAALATDLLGPAQIESMALLGSSAQAEGLIVALAAVRTLPRIDVYSPNPERRRAFCERMAQTTAIDVRPVESAQAAIRSANLICGAYRADGTPSIAAADLRSDAHVNSLSSVRAQSREIADDVWTACTQVVLDHRDGIAASGDGISAKRSGAFDLDRAPELWEWVRDGKRRTASDGRTMYKSVGAASQDLAVAARAYELARKRGLGHDAGEFPVLRKHN